MSQEVTTNIKLTKGELNALTEAMKNVQVPWELIEMVHGLKQKMEKGHQDINKKVEAKAKSDAP